MNILIIILSIILIFILIRFNNNENMTNTPNEKNTKCCLIEKQYLQDNKSIYNGNFKYLYTKKENKDCNLFNYDLNNNKQLLIDGVNNWSNEKCNDINSNLGSCRINNNECIEFVDKQYCDKIPGMIWSQKTCHNPLEFNWEDKIIRKIPEINKDDGTFVMFPEKLNKI